MDEKRLLVLCGKRIVSGREVYLRLVFHCVLAQFRESLRRRLRNFVEAALVGGNSLLARFDLLLRYFNGCQVGFASRLASRNLLAM